MNRKLFETSEFIRIARKKLAWLAGITETGGSNIKKVDKVPPLRLSKCRETGIYIVF